MSHVEETKAFLEEMGSATFNLCNFLTFDVNGQLVESQPTGLETVEFYRKKIEAGWRIDSDTELELLHLQKNIYHNLRNTCFVAQYQKNQMAIPNSIAAWKMLKDAGCRSIFEVYETDQIKTQTSSCYDEHVRDVLQSLPDEIFEYELLSSPQFFKYGIKGLMLRILENKSIQGQNPLAWAQSKGLLSLDLKEFWEGIELFTRESGHQQFKKIKKLDDTLNTLQMPLTLSNPNERLFRSTYFEVMILQKFLAESFPLLSKWGLNFKTMHLEKNRDTNHKNVFFCLSSFKYKDISAKIEASLIELQKMDPSKSASDWLNEKDEEGASVVHYCARNRDLNSLKMLQKWGADLNVVDNKGNTPIHWMMKTYSAKHEKTFAPILAWLIEQGVDVQTKNKKGAVAFQKLAKQGTLESLLSAIQIGGASLLKKEDYQGKTGLDMLLKRSDKEKILPITEKIILNDSLQKASNSNKNSKASKQRI